MKSAALLKDVKEELKKSARIYYLGIDDSSALLQEMGYEMYVFDYEPSKWKNIKKRFKERPAGLFALYMTDELDLKPKNPYKKLREGWNLGKDNYPKYTRMTINQHLTKPERLPRATFDDVVMEAKGPDALIINAKHAEDIILGAENMIMVYRPLMWLKDHTMKMWLEDREFKTEIRGDYLYAY